MFRSRYSEYFKANGYAKTLENTECSLEMILSRQKFTHLLWLMPLYSTTKSELYHECVIKLCHKGWHFTLFAIIQDSAMEKSVHATLKQAYL